MRRFLLTVSLSIAIFIAGAMVPERGSVAKIGMPAPVDCCDVRA